MPTDWPEARELALAAILPSGTDRYVALFDGDPIDGGTELTLTGYARVAHQNWTTASSAGESTRSNSTAITFAALNSAGQITHWGIYDAAVAGTLLRSGPIRDVLEQVTTISITGVGEICRFPIGSLRIRWTET